MLTRLFAVATLLVMPLQAADRPLVSASGAQLGARTLTGVPKPPPSARPSPTPPPSARPGPQSDPIPTTDPLATFQFGRGWATFGLALPQGAATSDLRVGALATQTDVKTRWPDGSIRFAIVTTRIVAQGSYQITTGAAPVGSFTPVWPKATVSFVTGGRTYVAALPAFTGADSWLSSDALVNESRVVVTPMAAGAALPVLQVIFDVRSYMGGGNRVDITVQNTQDVAEGSVAKYDVAIAIGGATVYTKTGITQAYMTRWRKTFADGFTEAAVTPDFEPFYASNAIPRFLPTVADPTPSSNGPKFDILQYGDMSVDMAAPGGRAEIAPYPNWVAQYLAHKRPEQRAYMLAQADLSGSWSGHITEPDGKTLITLDTYPDYWLDGRAGAHPDGPNAARVMFQGGAFPGGWSQSLETAHLPSLTFVPYLVTGDRFYLDQMKLWANFTLLKTWPGTGERQGGKGILMENQPRGFGWALRNLADTTAFLPDADPTREYFRSRLQNNLDFLDGYGRTNDGGPFEFVFVGKFPPNPRGNRVATLWMASYVGFALDRAAQLGFGPVAAMRDRIVRTQIRFFSSDAEGYPKIAGAPYYPDVGRAAGNATTWFTMKQIYDETGKTNVGGTGSAAVPFAGYYGPEARLMLQIGVREGIPGAQAALDYLAPSITGDLDFRSGWAVASVDPKAQTTRTTRRR